MNIDIIAKVIIPILGIIITGLIIPFIMQKTTKEQRDNICFWVSTAVKAAEMIYKEAGQGKLKKEYVVNFLVARGINITEQELDTLIEAAVKELNIVQNK
ncbi:MAG: phage holin, LLH family, partial [Bacillota bacterium]|nr:phage holin, LLH family [Bacillota bacterium]